MAAQAYALMQYDTPIWRFEHFLQNVVNLAHEGLGLARGTYELTFGLSL